MASNEGWGIMGVEGKDQMRWRNSNWPSSSSFNHWICGFSKLTLENPHIQWLNLEFGTDLPNFDHISLFSSYHNIVILLSPPLPSLALNIRIN
jgi:hypothetical protein